MERLEGAWRPSLFRREGGRLEHKDFHPQGKRKVSGRFGDLRALEFSLFPSFYNRVT
jgi:hypothetical protein